MQDRAEALIGLEIHARLLTKTKLLCACPNRFGDPPNVNVCPTCLGLPGALPTLNREAVRLAVAAALALGGRINSRSLFERKSYFYPDLPKGCQITQHGLPLSLGGAVPLPPSASAGPRVVPVRQLHLEEDAGKSVHDPASNLTLVDLNRCGAPLVEIVTEPAALTPAEAAACFKTMRRLLMALGACDGNMQEGSLRCDLNVSVRRAGGREPGPRVEMKNLSSFRHLEHALRFEVERQAGLAARGEPVLRETRQWLAREARTAPMRAKEDAHDYRIFPEPDLPPLDLEPSWVERIRRGLAERPWDRAARFQAAYGLTAEKAEALCAHPVTADYFEEVAKASGHAGRAAGFILTHVLGDMEPDGLDVRFPVPAAHAAAIVSMLAEGLITSAAARTVMEDSAAAGEHPAEVVARRGLGRITDEKALERLCLEALRDHPREAERCRAGRKALLRFFMGRVMEASDNRADPGLVKNILGRLLTP
jgi:aspartyl-tRNA(Asn)/glutamyl-tRNA(Gln) amidotransferase subunit B